jgi:hypothetical protein
MTNMGIDLKFDGVTDMINVKPQDGMNINIGEFLSGFVEGADIINKTEITTKIMDTIYGVFSKDANKTQQQIINELEVKTILGQMTAGDDSFIIPPSEYEHIMDTAKNISDGVMYYDLGCGVMAASYPFEELTDLVDTVVDSTDPFVIGEALQETIDISTSSTSATANNKETIKDNFFQMLIKTFTNELLYAVTSQPQIRMLLAIVHSFQNNGEELIASGQKLYDSGLDYIKKFKIMIKCIVKAIVDMIVKYIFELAIAYLIALLAPVIIKLTKEKIKQYIATLSSLANFGGIGKSVSDAAT